MNSTINLWFYYKREMVWPKDFCRQNSVRVFSPSERVRPPVHPWFGFSWRRQPRNRSTPAATPTSSSTISTSPPPAVRRLCPRLVLMIIGSPTLLMLRKPGRRHRTKGNATLAKGPLRRRRRPRSHRRTGEPRPALRAHPSHPTAVPTRGDEAIHRGGGVVDDGHLVPVNHIP